MDKRTSRWFIWLWCKRKIVKAIYELDIDGEISLYDKGKCIENDVCTQEVNWSEFEEREPEEILED